MFLPTWLAVARTLAYRFVVSFLIVAQLLVPAQSIMAAPVAMALPVTLDDAAVPPSADPASAPNAAIAQQTSPDTHQRDGRESSPPASLHVLSSGTVALGGQTTVSALIVNNGHDGVAEGMRVEIVLPPELVLVGGTNAAVLPSMQPRTSYTHTWTLATAPQLIQAAALPVTVSLHHPLTQHELEELLIAVVEGPPPPDTANRGGSASVVREQSALGTTLQAGSGLVQVVVPVTAAEAGTQFSLDILYDTQENEEAANAPTDLLASTPPTPPTPPAGGTIPLPPAPPAPTVSAPVAPAPTAPARIVATDPAVKSRYVFDDAGLPTVVDRGINFFTLWELRAQVPVGSSARVGNPDGAIHELEGGVLLRVDVSHLIAAGIKPTSLRIWTREDAGQRWEPLQPSAYDPVYKILSVWTYHFSQFGLGEGLGQSGDNLPNIKIFTADELTGAATASIAIDAPAGYGGMSPGIRLSYSSVIMDDWRLAAHSEDTIRAQASSVGAGWNLGGISYIARTDGNADDSTPRNDREYALVLNGQRVSVVHEDGQWRTNPELFASITRYNPESFYSGSGDFAAQDWWGWRVILPDGTIYEFGETEEFDENKTTTYNVTTIEIADEADEPEEENDYYRLTRRWYLRKIGDLHGNMLHFYYRSESDTLSSGVGADWVTAGENWFIRSIDPNSIYWSAHDDGSPLTEMDHTMRMLFHYSSVERIDIPDMEDDQGMYGRFNQLTRIDVDVKTDLGGTPTWETLRHYELIQERTFIKRVDGHDLHRNTLSKVQVYGTAATTVEREYEFTYELNAPNYVFLETVEDSWGGSVHFDMATWRISCSNEVCGTELADHLRWVVRVKVADDGQGYADSDSDGITDSQVRTEYDYGPSATGQELGAVDNNGGFVGFKEVIIQHFARGSATVVLQKELLTSYSEGAGGSRENPDPRWGRIKSRETMTALGQVFAKQEYDIKAYWYVPGTGWELLTPRDVTWTDEDENGDPEFPITWMRQEVVTQTVYPTTGAMAAVNVTQYSYFTATTTTEQFGNVKRVTELAGSGPLRITDIEYLPNTVNHIVNLPARIVLRDGAEVCVGETRNVYGTAPTSEAQYPIDLGYITPPTNPLLVKTETMVHGECSTAPTIGKYDTNWAITRYAYDAYGNQTTMNRLGADPLGTQDIIFQTTYDAVYHLFPIEQYYNAASGYKETAKYYGVNGLDHDHAHGYWGQMQEWCGINGVCTRQAYDNLGRKTMRWENQKAADAWPTDSHSATVWWDYWIPGANGSSQKTFMVREWNAPRCLGNLTRSHYNGFGELIAAHTSYQDWTFPVVGVTECAELDDAGSEIHTYYRYDGLGRQAEASVPTLHPHSDWLVATAATWPGGSLVTYDVLGRTLTTTAPNQSVTEYAYGGASGREQHVTSMKHSNDAGGIPAKRLLQWTDSDPLGNVTAVRTYDPTGSGWTLHAEVALTYDALNNLRVVDHPGISANTVITYNHASQKVGMDDPDLGLWRYGYDRQGRLTAQLDARGNLSCLYYDEMERLAGKFMLTGTISSCPASAPLTATVGSIQHVYGTTGASAGQVVETRRVGETGGDPFYVRTLGYDDVGRVITETKAIQSVAAPTTLLTATLGYGYDAYSRPHTLTYPDGEVVTTYFNGMGLPGRMVSSAHGVMVNGTVEQVDDVWMAMYDEAGRLTEMGMPAGGDLWRRVVYEDFTTNSPNGGMLAAIQVGTWLTPTVGVDLNYSWDSYGNVRAINGDAFTYDHQSRLLTAYGRTHAYDGAGRFTTFEDAAVTADSAHPHGADYLGGSNRYDYDAAGNVIARRVVHPNPETSSLQGEGEGEENESLQFGPLSPTILVTQNLTWTALNELESMAWDSTPIADYLYDENGERVRERLLYGSRRQIGVGFPPVVVGIPAYTEYEFFPQFEMRVSAEGTTTTKYYFFGGQRIAQKVSDATLTWLHANHLGSTVRTTGESGTGSYNGYGRQYNFGLPTEYTFTGQETDGSGLIYQPVTGPGGPGTGGAAASSGAGAAGGVEGANASEMLVPPAQTLMWGTGLVYMHARYYDPYTGQFVSPDTIVPDAGNVHAYNRYMYGYGNPLKYSDPSGHCALNEDGSENWTGDANMLCWQMAYAIMNFGSSPWTSFASEWRISPAEWMEHIGRHEVFDAAYLQPFADKYRLQFARGAGIHQTVVWHPVENPPVGPPEFMAAPYRDALDCYQGGWRACGPLLDDVAIGVTGLGAVACIGVTGGTCLAAVGMLGTGVSGASVGVTALDMTTGGDSTAADLVVGVTTLYGGFKWGTKAMGGAGFGVSVGQRLYDWWSGAR